jgi:hypothetical protein
MATQEQLTAQLEALKKARRSGLRRVRFGDREMEYRSEAEFAAAIRDLENEISAADGAPRRRRYFYPMTSKGL